MGDYSINSKSQNLTSSIIPLELSSTRNHGPIHIDYESICNWLSTGFFLGNTTILKNQFVRTALSKEEWNWHYSPRKISFEQVLDEFTNLFESLIQNHTTEKDVILPLSGGLDSRTLAAALRGNRNVVVVSYEFENGIQETEYARQIAAACGWEFHACKIHRGYLWRKLNELADINQCQTEFTHPRQMAVIDEIAQYGDLILSGQWGDVLFDVPGIDDEADLDEQTHFTIKKIAKPGGMELASELWKYWEMERGFKENFYETIQKLLLDIDIANPNSRVRAFKSLHWAPRWANANLKVFLSRREMLIPYYHDDMCKFICTVPEEYLAGRKIQIEYIKSKAPELARIPWQAYDLDLYNYQHFNTIYFPKRVYKYARRMIREKILKILPVTQRNWELQFLGAENERYLKHWIFETPELDELVPKQIIQDFYNRFKKVDPVKYSHPVSMLLTLAVWCKRFWKKV